MEVSYSRQLPQWVSEKEITVIQSAFRIKDKVVGWGFSPFLYYPPQHKHEGQQMLGGEAAQSAPTPNKQQSAFIPRLG